MNKVLSLIFLLFFPLVSMAEDALPQEEATVVIANVDVQKTAEAVDSLIEAETEKSANLEKKLDESTENARKEAHKAKKVDEKIVATARLNLEEQKQKLHELFENVIEKLKFRNEYYKKILDEKNEWSKKIEQGQPEVEVVYQESIKRWRELVDEAFQIYTPKHEENKLHLPIPLVPPTESLKNLGENNYSKAYYDSEKEVNKIRMELLGSYAKFLEVSRRHHYNVLRAVGKIRARAIERLLAFGDDKPTKVNREYLGDLKREAYLIPFRALALASSKKIEIDQKSSEGIIGVFDLLKQGVFLFLVIIIPIVLGKWSIFRVTQGLFSAKESLLKNSGGMGWKYSLGLWIPRILPLVPWVLLISFLGVAENLINDTVMAELTLLIPYFSYYAYYRIIRLFISHLLSFLSSKANSLKDIYTRNKIDNTAKNLALFYFWSLLVLHTVESVSNRGLIYRNILPIVGIFTACYLLWILYRWRFEIEGTLNSPDQGKISKKLCQLSQGKLGLVFRAIGLLWLFGSYIYQSLALWIGEFEFAKRFSAKLFRQQLEGANNLGVGTDHSKIPQDYLKWFQFSVAHDENFRIDPGVDTYGKVKADINDWLSEKWDESLVAICGKKGSGKSTLLKILESHYQGKISILQATVPPKIITKEEILNFVRTILNSPPLKSGEDLVEFDKTLPKTLILLDECQNLFLGRLGGFEGYKYFIELLNEQTQNIFWICVFNQQSWNYLDSAFGKNSSFRSVYELKGWDEDNIKRLIMTRHQLSGYQLSFDQIISAVQNSTQGVDYSAIETKFFRLLWKQSGGNPRAALYYWLSSLKDIQGTTLRVGIPADDNFIPDFLNNDQLFILACLVKHENLSVAEMVSTTDLSEGIIRHTFKICLENDFIIRDSMGRFRISAEAQNALLWSLQKKNFIYG